MKSSFFCKLSLKCSGKKLCDWSTCSHEEPCSVRTALRGSIPVTSCNMKNIKSNIKLCKFKENQTPCNVWWRWSQRGGVQVSERATTFHESLVWNITNKTARPHLTESTLVHLHTEDPCQRWFNEEEEKGVTYQPWHKRRHHVAIHCITTATVTAWMFVSIHSCCDNRSWLVSSFHLLRHLCISMFKHILYFDKSTVLKITHMWPKRAKSAQTDLET